MGERQKVKVYVESFDSRDFVGGLDEFYEKLEACRADVPADAHLYIDHNYCHDELEVIVYYDRLETDEEYEARVTRQTTERARRVEHLTRMADELGFSVVPKQ